MGFIYSGICSLLYIKLWELGLNYIASDLNKRRSLTFYIIPGDGNAAYVVILGDLIHDIQHELLDDGTKGTGSGVFFHSLLCDGFQGTLVKLKIDLIQGKKLLVLLENSVLGLLEDLDQHILGEGLQRADNGKSSQELRDHAELLEVVNSNVGEKIGIILILVLQIRIKTDGCLFVESLCDYLNPQGA